MWLNDVEALGVIFTSIDSLAYSRQERFEKEGFKMEQVSILLREGNFLPKMAFKSNFEAMQFNAKFLFFLNFMQTSTISNLKAQLQQKVSQKRHAVEDVFGRKAAGTKQGNYLVPSLIYPANVAADQVPEFLYEKAVDTIEELAASFSWWRFYQHNILNNFMIFTKGPLVDRGSLTTAESNKVSEEVSLLLKALIPCLLIPSIDLTSPSAKNPLHLVEFLCRRLRIHEFEVNELIFMSLLYHETPLFKLLVSLVKFNKCQEWKFLLHFFESNVPISRDHLVSQLVLNNGFLLGKFYSFVRSIIATGSDPNGLLAMLDYRNLISFFSAIYYEAILKFSADSKKQHIRLSMLTNILKNIKSSRKEIFKDWYISQLLLLIPLLYSIDLTASRATENNGSEFMAQFIIRKLVCYEHPSARPHILSLICCICQLFYEQAKATNFQFMIDFSCLESISQWQNIDTLLSSTISNLESSAFVKTVQLSLAAIPSALLESSAFIGHILPFFSSKITRLL